MDSGGPDQPHSHSLIRVLVFVHNRSRGVSSRKHAYIILTCLNPILYSKTGVYRGTHYFFLILLKIINCGYSCKPPHRGGSDEYP